MKKFIALLLTAFLIISCTACGESSENKKITEPKVSQMKSICELAVMDCYYHNVAKYNEKMQAVGGCGHRTKNSGLNTAEL